MRRIVMFLLLSLAVSATTAFSFDLEKSQANYHGAEFEVAAIKEMLYENAPAIAISFTVPLDKEFLEEEHVTIEGGEFDHWILSDDRTKIIFPFVAPETEYVVFVSNVIQNINGQSLRFPQKGEVKTARLTPSVSFATSAHIISSSSPKHLPVTTLNVDEVTLMFFHIHEDKLPGLSTALRQNGADRYYVLEQIKEYADLVHTGRFSLNLRKNQRTEYNIDLSNIKALKPAGAYLAVMNEPGAFDYISQHAFFMQSDIGVHVRKYEKSFDVYTQDITSGMPLKGIQVEISSNKGEIINKGITDKNGRISFQYTADQYHLIAKKGKQLSALLLDRGALDLSALKNADTQHSEYQIFAWGPRDLYRPGEKVDVNILVRNYDGLLPAAMPLKALLTNPDGSTVSNVVLQPTDTGFYTFSYTTNSNSQAGLYHLYFAFAEVNKVQYDFQVEEFLPERLDLQLFDGYTDAKRTMESPEMIEVPVTSNYLYGAPAAGNEMDGFALAGIDDHPFDNLPTFFFGDRRETFESRRPEFNRITLDNDGTGVLKMTNPWVKIKSPVRVRINASVYETGGRPVTRSAMVTLLNSDNFIGLEPQFEGRPDSDSTVDFKVGYANLKGQWQAGKDLQLKLIHMDRDWYWHHTNSRGWHWAWSDDPVTVFAKTINTKNGQTTQVSVPLSGGNYVLEVTDGTTTTSYAFRTSWSWWDNTITDSSRKPDQVSLGFNKSTYQPGEIAKLRIDPPQDGLALVTVESSEEVLFTSYVKVKSEGTIIDIATESTWSRHDLYASVMVIRPGDMKTTPVPTRSFGMVHLPLRRANTKFDVTIDVPKRVASGKTITANINLKTEQGPIPPGTKVVVALVDVGILNITRYETPDAQGYMFGARRYNIELYDNYGDIIDNLGPKSVRQRFGGDYMDSEEELSHGGEKPKSDVMMVSFFSEPLPVDSQGNVSVSFELPNFNGRLRWMVQAFAHEQFGSTDEETTVADNVVTQIAMPRFMALGDKSTMALDLHNLSGEDQDLTLEISLRGAFAGLNETQVITLADKEKTTIRLDLVSQSSSGQGVVSIHLTGSSTNTEAKVDISRIWRLGMRSAYTAVTRKTNGSIKAQKKWTPKLKTDDLVPSSIQVQMTLSNQPPIDMATHFQYLLHYPYGCLEQATSSGYPWVLASASLLDELGLSAQVKKQFGQEYTESFRKEQAEKAVQLVLNRLKSNGSFGLWSSDSPEDKWLTVYAADFLYEAKKMGVGVSASTMNKINKRLNSYLSGSSGSTGNRWSEDSDHYSFAYRSYAAYVLTNSTKVHLSDLRRLAKKYRDKTDDDGLSWMYMAAAFKLAGDSKNSDAAAKLAAEQWKRVRYRYYGEYGSSVRDLCRIIEIGMLHDLSGNKDLVSELSHAVADRRWLNTQERISLFRLAMELAQDQTEIWTATLHTEGGQQDLARKTVFNSIFNLGMFQKLSSIQAGNETIYASVSLVGDPKEAPKPISQDMTIKRTFYDLDGNKMVPTIMKSGEMAVVKLTISTSTRTPDGLVVDLLPAGMEIENSNLAVASVNLNEIRIDGKPIGELITANDIKHMEFRDDRFVAAVSLQTYRTTTLFYLVRAVTPGVYAAPGSYVEDMYRPYRHAIGASYNTLTVTE